MPSLRICTDEERIRYWDKEYVEKVWPYTRYCIENVSEELYKSIIDTADNEENKRTISLMLYCVLDKKWISSN